MQRGREPVCDGGERLWCLFYGLKLIKLQVNPISGLLPGHSPLAAGAHVSGIPFDELLAEIVDSAMRREQGTWTDNEPKSLLA